MENFHLVFIPLFVAFDAIGLVPVFWSISQNVAVEKRKSVIHNAILVAWIVGPIFLLLSDWVFAALGVLISDVMIAGGVILFVLALNDLLRPEKASSHSAEDFGIVPLGVPLIVGPAVLTTLLLLNKHYGFSLTWLSFNLNILFVWFVLLCADKMQKWMGREGAKVVSKISNLVLAAFAVMLIRRGLTEFLSNILSR
jgi:multiple antibiotic resistance protein